MLKLTYTEAGLHMERLNTSLEMLIAQRAVLALRCGSRFHIEPGRASFLLSATVPELIYLKVLTRQEWSQSIAINPVDKGFVEIRLFGSWVADVAQAHEGMFLAEFRKDAEFWTYKLWQQSQSRISTLA